MVKKINRLHLFLVFWLYYIFFIRRQTYQFKVHVIKRQKKKKKKKGGEREKYFVLLSILTGV